MVATPKTGNEPITNLELTSNKKNSPGSEVAKREPEKYQLFARYMWERIQPLSRTTKLPNFETWARDLRLLVERDGRTEREVKEIFDWANTDSFWKSNILSPAKLREKFDDLVVKKNHSPNRMDSTSVTQRTQTLIDQLNREGWDL